MGSDRLPTDMNLDDIEKQALWELDLEDHEKAVEKRKEQLRTKRPWHVWLFPWKIQVTRRF